MNRTTIWFPMESRRFAKTVSVRKMSLYDDGAVVVISLPLIILFLLFRNKDYVRSFKKRSTKDETIQTKTSWERSTKAFPAFFSLAALSSVTLLTGCHGAKDQSAFTIPGEFEHLQRLRSLSGPKTTQTKPRPKSIKRQYPILKPCTLKYHRRSSALHGLRQQNLQRCNLSTSGHRHHLNVRYHLPGTVALISLTGNDTVVLWDSIYGRFRYGLSGDKRIRLGEE